MITCHVTSNRNVQLKVLVFFLLLYQVLIYGQWSTPFLLDSLSADSTKYVQIAADPHSGSAMVVFMQKIVNEWAVLSTSYIPSQGWQHPTYLGQITGNVEHISLTYLGSGKYVAVFTTGGIQTLGFRKVYDGTTWNGTILDLLIENTTDLVKNHTVVADTVHKKAIALWEEYDNTYMIWRLFSKTYSPNNGWQTVSDNVSLSTTQSAMNFQIAASSNGTFICAFEQMISQKKQICASLHTGSAWIKTQLTSSADSSYKPAVAMDNAGNARVVYVCNDTLYGKYFNGSVWSSKPEYVGTLNHAHVQGEMQLTSVGTSDYILAVNTETMSGKRTISYFRYSIGTGQWSEMYSYPQKTTSSEQEAYFSYNQSSDVGMLIFASGKEVQSRRFTCNDGLLPDPDTVCTSGDTVISPKVVVTNKEIISVFSKKITLARPGLYTSFQDLDPQHLKPRITFASYIQQSNELVLRLSRHATTINQMKNVVISTKDTSLSLKKPWSSLSPASHDSVIIRVDKTQAKEFERGISPLDKIYLSVDSQAFYYYSYPNDPITAADPCPVIFLADTEKPMPVTALRIVAVNCSTATALWENSTSVDSDSILFFVSDVAMPKTVESAKQVVAIPVSLTSCRITHLNPSGVTHYVSCFVKDEAGNYSSFSTEASQTFKLTTGVVPINTITAQLYSILDTVVQVTIRVPFTDAFQMKGFYYSFTKDTITTGISGISLYSYHDTLFVERTVKPGKWFASWTPVDMSNNVGLFKYDSIVIVNTKPSLVLDKKYTIKINREWKVSNFVYDCNLDTVTLSIIQGPVGLQVSANHVLSWLPLAKDIGEHDVIIAAFDGHGGIDSARVKLIVSSSDEQEKIVLYKKEIAYGALRCTYKTPENNNSSLSFKTTIKNRSGSFEQSIRNSTGVFQWYPLANGVYEIVVSCFDTLNNRIYLPLHDTVAITSATVFGFAPRKSWQMISIPARITDATPFKNQGSLAHWDETVSTQSSDFYKYYQTSEKISRLSAGHSYWSKQDTPVRIEIDTQGIIRDSFVIKLNKSEYGWNQIACPFPYPVAWNSSLILWRYNTQKKDFEPSEGILKPWEGYWTYTDIPRHLVLKPIPTFSESTTIQRTSVQYLDEKNWTITAVLRSNENCDEFNRIGIQLNATDTFDIRDQPEPPFRGGEPRLSFVQQHNRSMSFLHLADDFRSGRDTAHLVFQLCISSCNELIKTLSLHFRGIDQVKDQKFFLVCREGSQLLHDSSIITLTPSPSDQYMNIVVTRDATFLEKVYRTFFVSHPYPNPSKGFIALSYVLPYQWNTFGLLSTTPLRVTAEVFDLRGRMIARLFNTYQNPGAYTVRWDGKGQDKRSLSTGTYFIRINTQTQSAVRKALLIR